LINSVLLNSFNPAIVVEQAGSTKIPSLRAISITFSINSSSQNDNAVPLYFSIIFKTSLPKEGLAILILLTDVFGFLISLILSFDLKAFTIGEQPLA